MGLDMYLYLKENKYTSSLREKELIYPSELQELEKDIRDWNFASKDIEIYYQIGYWRKANAIHKWFVDECGEGVDECQKIYVPLAKLKELQKKVDKVLKNHDLAPKELPTEDGFFFGTTEYSDWYFDDLEYTKQLLAKIIPFVETHDKYELIYQASW